MCTLLLWKHEHPRFGLIAAANRDEFLGRPSTGPQALVADPLVVGGRDETAGGTWFAVSEHGLIVALTNRRGAGGHDPSKRSRGGLVIEAARSQTLDEALARVRAIDARAYNPFVLFAGDARAAFAAHGGDDGLRVEHVADGAHAITNWDLDALQPPKAAQALRAARGVDLRAGPSPEDVATSLHALLGGHGAGRGDATAFCVHRDAERYGTRSTTIALLAGDPGQTRIFHAEGPACVSTLVEVSRLLRHESGSAAPKRATK